MESRVTSDGFSHDHFTMKNPNKPRDLAGGAVVLLPPQSQRQQQQPPASECCVRTKRRRRRAIAPTRNACLSAFAIGLMLLSQFAVVEAQSPGKKSLLSCRQRRLQRRSVAPHLTCGSLAVCLFV
jgi:hypothetical protein